MARTSIARFARRRRAPFKRASKPRRKASSAARQHGAQIPLSPGYGDESNLINDITQWLTATKATLESEARSLGLQVGKTSRSNNPELQSINADYRAALVMYRERLDEPLRENIRIFVTSLVEETREQLLER